MKSWLGLLLLASAGVVAPAAPEPLGRWEKANYSVQNAPTIAETYRGIPVTVTAYNAVPEQTDSDPHIASCGPLAAVQGPIVALSRDLFLRDGRKRCGELVIVQVGEATIVATVWDTMAARFTSRVDVLMETVGEARQWGKQGGYLLWGGQ